MISHPVKVRIKDAMAEKIHNGIITKTYEFDKYIKLSIQQLIYTGIAVNVDVSFLGDIDFSIENALKMMMDYDY